MMTRKLMIALAVSALSGFLLCSLQGCSNEEKQSTEQSQEDTRVLEDVKTKVSNDPALETAVVEFTNQNGVIIITGTVDSPTQENYLKNTVQSVQGVKSVESKVKYAGGTAAAPAESTSTPAVIPGTTTTPNPSTPNPTIPSTTPNPQTDNMPNPNNTQLNVPPSTPTMTTPSQTQQNSSAENQMNVGAATDSVSPAGMSGTPGGTTSSPSTAVTDPNTMNNQQLTNPNFNPGNEYNPAMPNTRKDSSEPTGSPQNPPKTTNLYNPTAQP